MTVDEAFNLCCAVVGEMSLAVVRAKAPRAVMVSWIKRLRQVADALELKTGKVE